MQHFSPRQITFEITESRLAKDLAPVLDILARLRLHRFKLSIDDFGTGHSSLLQLRDLPFDELKIDQGFVHDAHNEHRMNAIVKASIALAKHLEMESVAEGVETIEDWRNMQTLGADIAQGYFIAKPMPFAELENWHQQWRQRIQQENLLTPLI
jgi:EAL domain-containing protein (putative c-di-GMP-specific phosphodiesterase class I)